MLRYAVEDMHIGLTEFWDMFLISGVADLFGKGDFRFLVGMSGVETAWEVVWRLTGEWPQEKPTFNLEKSPIYWTGWILAWYQWYSGQNFRRISEFLTPVQVRDMYHPYHEMDPVQFADAADRIRRQKEMTTRLRMYRERMGLSQSELARESGVSVRMIQHYEQRQKDLNKAQMKTIWLLARALQC
jgi:DNA-binding transcriptional regulator YiaG